jgi:hypothetical protein
VLTKQVESQPDGVHLEISNLLEGRADLSVSHSGGGMGWSVPKGESKRVANVPPGKVEIDCYGRSWSIDKLLMTEGAETIQVVAGDSGYKSTKLDCPREKKMEPFTKEETEEQKGTPSRSSAAATRTLCGKATSSRPQATPGAGTKGPCAWYAMARWSPRPTTSNSLPAGWRKTASGSEALDPTLV